MVADNHISIYTGRRKNRFCCRLLENVTFHPFPSQINSLTSSVEWNACFSTWHTPQLSRLTLPSSIALHSKAQFLNTPHFTGPLFPSSAALHPKAQFVNTPQFTGPLLPSSDAHPLSMSMIRNVNNYICLVNDISTTFNVWICWLVHTHRFWANKKGVDTKIKGLHKFKLSFGKGFLSFSKKWFVCSVPLLFANWIVKYLNLLQAKFQFVT